MKAPAKQNEITTLSRTPPTQQQKSYIPYGHCRIYPDQTWWCTASCHGSWSENKPISQSLDMQRSNV